MSKIELIRSLPCSDENNYAIKKHINDGFRIIRSIDFDTKEDYLKKVVEAVDSGEDVVLIDRDCSDSQHREYLYSLFEKNKDVEYTETPINNNFMKAYYEDVENNKEIGYNNLYQIGLRLGGIKYNDDSIVLVPIKKKDGFLPIPVLNKIRELYDKGKNVLFITTHKDSHIENMREALKTQGLITFPEAEGNIEGNQMLYECILSADDDRDIEESETIKYILETYLKNLNAIHVAIEDDTSISDLYKKVGIKTISSNYEESKNKK
jgi:hypothetical protein